MSDSPAPETRAPKPPRPTWDRDSAFFWEGALRGELLVQRCHECGVLRHPPRPMCAACQSLRWEPVATAGRGVVYSFVVHHHPPVYGFEPPFTIVLVELEEGVRMVGNLLGVEPEAVEIGMPVAVHFETVDGGDDAWTLPQWRPHGNGDAA